MRVFYITVTVLFIYCGIRDNTVVSYWVRYHPDLWRVCALFLQSKFGTHAS